MLGEGWKGKKRIRNEGKGEVRKIKVRGRRMLGEGRGNPRGRTKGGK